MRVERTGFYFIEGMPTANGAKAGLTEPDKWKSYKLWASDKWRCPDCGATILSGFGNAPISIHHMPEFESTVRALGAELLVKDC
jgi:hypothetical protein